MLGLALSPALVAALAPPPAAVLVATGPRGSLLEDGYDLDVAVDGMVATVTARQRLRSVGWTGQEAIYRFDVPTGAAITDLSVRLPGGRTARGLVVDARAAMQAAARPELIAGAADLAVLRQIDGGAPGRVACELRLYPVDAEGVEVQVRWVAPLGYRQGRLGLRIPGRGPDLAPPVVRVTGAGGARVSEAGVPLPAAADARFHGRSGGDLLVEMTPGFAGDGLRAVHATWPLGPGATAIGLLLVAQRARRPDLRDFDRLVLLVDTSRSVSAAGLRAARALSLAVLEVLPPATRVEAVLFDRRPRRALGELAANDASARRRIDAALAAAAPGNGSDLGAALDELGRVVPRAAVGGREPRTLVVLVTDGRTPRGLDGRAARERLGDSLADDIHLVSVLLCPDGAAAPPGDELAAGELALGIGGRVLVLHHSEAAERRSQLAADLARPAPFTDLAWAQGELAGVALPAEITPGDAVLVWGWLPRPPPAGATLRARRRGQPVTVRVERAAGGLARAVGPLWLARAGAEDLLSSGERGVARAPDQVPDEVRAAAERSFARAAARAHVLTPATALVALDPADALARERAAALARWGAAFFQRLPPPPERGDDAPATAPPRALAWRAGDEPRPPDTQPTGELDAGIVGRLLHERVLPAARACYDRALLAAPELAGALTLEVQLDRGEVTFAATGRSSLPATEAARALERCVVDAAYSMDVPAIAVGTDPDDVIVARWPLTFRVVRRRSAVDATGLEDAEDPLGGLPHGADHLR